MIAPDISHLYGSTLESLRYASFQVSSIMTTAGFATTDVGLWSSYSKGLLLSRSAWRKH